MLDLALAWAGGLLIGLALALAHVRRRKRLRSGLTFEDVCRAAADAKLERRTDENHTRDFTDGADAVMAELLERGHGDNPGKMQAAYLASGEEPELEVDES